MSSDFEYDGLVYLSKTGKNLVIDLDGTVFKYHVGVKALQDVLSHKKRRAAVWHPRPRERIAAASKDPDL